MLEAVTIEAIDVKARGGREKYAEWHHAREALRLQRDVYSNKSEVAKFLNAPPPGANGETRVAAASQGVCDATASQEYGSIGVSQSDASIGITSSLVSRVTLSYAITADFMRPDGCNSFRRLCIYICLHE